MRKRKGILLAGGSGTRLHPATLAISKQLLPVFDKPMIYYPLSSLMLAGIRDIMVISTPDDIGIYKKMFGSGEQWGIRFSYKVQPEPKGIAQALLIAEDFLDGDPCALILGDNIFYGSFFYQSLQGIEPDDATIFAYRVNDPRPFGVIEFDRNMKAVGLEEKPEKPKSKYAVPGLYYYDGGVVDMVREQKASPRGELEITDLNLGYLNEGRLNVRIIGRGSAWFDAGTHEALLAAGNFVAAVEQQQGMKLACPEEIALRKHWVTIDQYKLLIENMGISIYRNYLVELLETDFAEG